MEGTGPVADGTGQTEVGLKPWEQDALEALQWDWDTAYLIGHDDEHGWFAGRLDKIGDLITADDPDALRREIAENYATKPVPREPLRREAAQPAGRALGTDPGELLAGSAEL
jgi:hypothetical protein